MTISVSDEHPLKADEPISVTEEGICSIDKEEHSEKENIPIISKELDRTISLSAVQPKKA